MRKHQITLKDLAKELNISKSTVSRALRDCDDINPVTKQKVLDLAEKWDYYPNKVAMNLIKGKSHTIGVVIPSFSIPFYAQAISGIQNYLANENYNIIVCQSNESVNLEKQNIDILIRSSVDGIIISLSKETDSVDHIHKLIAKGIPVAFFNRVYNLSVPTVRVDDYQGAYDMVSFIIHTKRKNIAHIAGPHGLQLSKDRKNGYIQALKDNGLTADNNLIIPTDFTYLHGKYCMEQLLKTEKPIDAVFCVCDATAFGAMKALKEQGIGIPGDIAIAGFTDEPTASLVEPALTTVSQPIYEIGQTAAKLLLRQVKSNMAWNAPENCILPAKLTIRKSCY